MRFLELGPYVERPRDLQGPMEGDRDVDVAVVGGGYTGLATALALCGAGARVAVLERDFAGAGASGRNAGHLTPTIGKDLPTLLRLLGRERAAALVRFADRAVEHTEEAIAKHGIDCAYRPTGNLLAGVVPAHEGRLRRAAEAGSALGARVRFVPEGEMRERGLPRAFACGVLEEAGGTLDPGAYVLGLRRAALAAGAELYESTAVETVEAPEDASRVRLRTSRGAVRADHAVIATNAWTPQLGWRRRAVVPLAVSLFETAPLDEGRRAALGWPGGEGIYTAHEILESYRVTHRGTVVGGSKRVRYAYGSGLPSPDDPASFRTIERAFRDRFPELAGVPVAHAWSGWIAFAPDFLPLLGVAGLRRNLHYGMGYAGHGVAQATLMGAMLAEQVQGREHPQARALARRTFAWPPEPLRWLAFHAIAGALRALDARTDRRARCL